MTGAQGGATRYFFQRRIAQDDTCAFSARQLPGSS